MILLKTMLCAGVYHLEKGADGFGPWSGLMREEFGFEVEPYLQDLYQDALALMYRRTGPCEGKRNCWQFKGCRKEVRGESAEGWKPCPASTDCRLDGVHGGRNAGRCCWVVNGTMCDGTVQSFPAEKRACCGSCPFLELVRREQGTQFLLKDEHLRLMLSQRDA